MNDGQYLYDLSDRAAAALHEAGIADLKKNTKQAELLRLLAATALSAADQQAVAALVEVKPKVLAAISDAEQLRVPLLRDTALPRTRANELREADTYNLFFNLLRFRHTALASRKPGPKPAAEPWFGKLATWVVAHGAVVKLATIGERAGLSKSQVSSLLAGTSEAAATPERARALHEELQKALQAALDELPPLA